MRRNGLSFFIVAIVFLLISCEKRDAPVVLPQKGSNVTDRVDMGEDYEDQIFYDLDKGRVVLSSPVNSWDLAFEASPSGFHVFTNTGKDIWVYNSHATDIYSVMTPPQIKASEWVSDASCGLPDSTAIGNWTTAGTKEVYILKLNPAHFADTFKKIVLVNYSSSHYTLMYSDLRENNVKTITIPKDDNFNYAYFSFDDGGKITYPEPNKTTWDIVFTRYRYIYHELNNFPYLVTGVLLNPYRTTGSADSTIGYDATSIANIATTKFVDFRDIIGFTWKSYSIPAGKYTVNKEKTYIIKTQLEQYWKLHFLDFYNSSGIKGSPTFEFERLQ